ncbi:hypothetical protein [Marinifilum fragile]|uniref:hypothetical protein n=1 Tax=Marinifilum fragile TaxID=570161 RepID=UPI002AAAC240|nr:hypothetical protein [Marinifilum fragile]
MIWTIIIIIGVIILFSFFNSLNKDNHELNQQSLPEKFQFVVNTLNKAAYNGNGNITILNKRSFNLYENGQNQIINFHYSTGHLTITWKYKYFHKEIIHEKQFDDVRNLSLFEQQKMAEVMINEMSVIIEKHQSDILKNM